MYCDSGVFNIFINLLTVWRPIEGNASVKCGRDDEIKCYVAIVTSWTIRERKQRAGSR